MKQRIIALLALFMMLMTSVLADTAVGGEYTDAPTAMTQDSVIELTANESCQAETLEPDEQALKLLDSVYSFVWKEGNRPARYYDEATQQKISALAGGIDIDLLHMTEAMRLQLSGTTEKDVTVQMLLDVDYCVNQLVIVVLGICDGEDEYNWYPYLGRVETVGEIKWDMPSEDWNKLCQQPISFHVLTDRIGPRGGRLWGMERYADETPPIFSKDSGDVNNVRYWYSEWGERIEDDFCVWLLDLTEEMNNEVLRIGQHLEDGKALLDYFPVERKTEALLMLPEGTDAASLIAYDIIAVRSENYKDAYGDVNAEITFGTSYTPGKAMTILAGFPLEGAKEAPYFTWYVMRAEAIEAETVEISFKQLNLPQMETEPMMLVVISQRLVN